MADNFDDIELYQTSAGKVQEIDPQLIQWLLRNFAAIKAHLESLQQQITGG